MKLIEFFVWIVLPLVTFVYYYLKKKFSFFKNRGIPHVEPSWPMGNLKGISTEYHFFELVQKLYRENKGKDVIAGVYSFVNPVFMITDPELAKTITIKDFSNFMNRGQFVNEENEPLTGHLFAIEDERWKYLRNKLSPVFTSGKIKSMFDVVNSKGDNLVKTIELRSQYGSIETKDLTNRFTVDVISSCVFGMEANTLNDENEMLIKFFKEIFGNQNTSFVKFILIAMFPKIAKLLRIRVFSEGMSNFFMNVVSDNIKTREDTNDKRKDFLNMLIQLKNKGSIEGEFSSEVKKLTLNEVLAQAFLFYFAGSDTSSTTISFALSELANNQEIQSRLRSEITEKTKSSNGELTYDNLQDMTYLNHVMNG
jgi:cytochrome P450 family 6